MTIETWGLVYLGATFVGFCWLLFTKPRPRPTYRVSKHRQRCRQHD